MNHKTFMSLLEKKKDNIIRTIKAVVADSFMPDFYGIYEIYLNEADGQIYVLQVDCEKTFSQEDSHRQGTGMSLSEKESQLRNGVPEGALFCCYHLPPAWNKKK